LYQLLSKATVASCSFYIKYSMSFLLDDTLLKYVVTEVVLFSIVAFKILTFHKVVQWHTWGVVGSLVTVLLKMFSWFWQRN